MTNSFIVDAGPLVAYLDARDRFHPWAVETLSTLPPFTTCEPVLSEACFLLRRVGGGPERLLQLVERGALRLSFSLQNEVGPVKRLMAKYADAPMSLADACLVRMAELDRAASVVTVDSDFTRYRLLGRQAVPHVMPPNR